MCLDDVQSVLGSNCTAQSVTGLGLDERIQRVYAELRKIAAAYLRGESASITLQPTALVHEAFLRLAKGSQTGWSTPEEFFGMAARAMRQLLVDHARSKGAVKRGGPGRRNQVAATAIVSSNPDDCAAPVGPELEFDAAELSDALASLEGIDPRLAKVVELRFFLGLTVPEVARALSLSVSAVESDWRLARAWLASHFSRRG